MLIRVGLKAVELLIANGSLSEAAQVMKVLQLRFPAELKVDSEPPKQAKHKDDEAAVLQSLDQLSVT